MRRLLLTCLACKKKYLFNNELRSACSTACMEIITERESRRRLARISKGKLKVKAETKKKNLIKRVNKAKQKRKVIKTVDSNRVPVVDLTLIPTDLSNRQKTLLNRLLARQAKEFNSDRQRQIDGILKKKSAISQDDLLKKEIEKLRGEIRSLKQRKTPSGFYDSREWRDLRYRVLKQYGRICMCCRTTTGIIHVDHIKPRSKYPELELSFDNLQVLCEDCNLGKSNKDETDWRPKLEQSN